MEEDIQLLGNEDLSITVPSVALRKGMRRRDIRNLASNIVNGNSEYDIVSYNPDSSKENKRLNNFYNRIKKKNDKNKLNEQAEYLAYLKQADPKQFGEAVRNLTSLDRSGDVDARYILGKTGEAVARDRRGYEGLQKFAMAAPLVAASGLFAPALGQAAVKATPWIMKNIAIPVLGGEIVNEGIKYFSNGQYGGFSDWAYKNSGLDKLSEGTKAEPYVRTSLEMFNPGFYGSKLLTKNTLDLTKKLVSDVYDKAPIKIRYGGRKGFRYRNIGNSNYGLEDLYSTGTVNAAVPGAVGDDVFFGHSGKLVNPEMYAGKWFVAAPEHKYLFEKPYENLWGYTPNKPVALDDVKIGRRIFNNVSASIPFRKNLQNIYLEYNPKWLRTSKGNLYNYYSGARRVRSMNGFENVGQSRWPENAFENLIGKGVERAAYLVTGPQGDYILKVGERSFNPLKNPNFLKRRALSNGEYVKGKKSFTEEAFPEVPELRYVGVKVSPDGILNPVFKQQYIEGVNPKHSEIEEGLLKLGYKASPDALNTYVKNGITFKDLHSKNIIVDNNGNWHIIDPNFTSNVQFNADWQYKQGGKIQKHQFGNIISKVKNSSAEFVKRLSQFSGSIPDWENPENYATHKLSYVTNDDGSATVYPEVQNINGKLIDFTRPPYHSWAGYDSAIERQDTVRMPNEEMAKWFTENYKKYFEGWKQK